MIASAFCDWERPLAHISMQHGRRRGASLCGGLSGLCFYRCIGHA